MAELGFLGVVVYTRVHTPRRCGHASNAGTFDFSLMVLRPLRINWLVVAIRHPSPVWYKTKKWANAPAI